MSESDNIRKKMQELKTKENELASLRHTLSKENDKCSRLSEEYENLKANNRDFIELQQQLDKVMDELVEANRKREELLKEEQDIQDQENKLQEDLDEAGEEYLELRGRVAAGEADAEQNGSRLAECKKTIMCTAENSKKLQSELDNYRSELLAGKNNREDWEVFLQQARSLLLAIEATTQLLEENGSLVKENHFAKLYKKEFGKKKQLQDLCLDDRMYLRQ